SIKAIVLLAVFPSERPEVLFALPIVAGHVFMRTIDVSQKLGAQIAAPLPKEIAPQAPLTVGPLELSDRFRLRYKVPQDDVHRVRAAAYRFFAAVFLTLMA